MSRASLGRNGNGRRRESPLIVRYDIRPMPTGWTVVDAETGDLARVDDFAAEALSKEEAGEIADLLNTLEFLRRGTPAH
jgi:hypothetical protein